MRYRGASVSVPVWQAPPQPSRFRAAARIVTALLLIGAIAWLGIPAARAYLLVRSAQTGHAPAPPRGLVVRSVEFRATDGVRLSGWLIQRARTAPTVILIPGFKAGRTTMVPYARMVSTAGYNVLLYDPRGTGESGGSFGLGVRDSRDVLGAVRYLSSRSDLASRRYAVLGVSLGSGVAIDAATRTPLIRAVIADSPYVDDRREIDRLNQLHAGPLSLPLAPIGRWVVDRLLGFSTAAFSPLGDVRRLGSRGLLLIHSRYDANPTTPLADAEALYHADSAFASLWIAPLGGHAGAIDAQPRAYRSHVIPFLRGYLGGQ
ncbi:MAG TPA: prolyl oligopeptidase family serine peptidase [Chloroflexota bacterium]|nr:prolyl oligopeptidase family serine peptidase [Chloroflexota bacterium]